MTNSRSRWARLVATGFVTVVVTASCGASHPLAVGSALKTGIATGPPSFAPKGSLGGQAGSPGTTAQSPNSPKTSLPPTPPTQTSPVSTHPSTSPTLTSGGPSIGGCPVFPSDNVWNTDVSRLPVDPHSNAWIANTGGSGRLIHPDFGDSGTSVPYGIPFIVTNASHSKVNITFQYADESDPGPYPFGPDTPIEGGAGSGGDQHAIMLDSSTCTLYELYDASYSAQGSTAGSGAIWNLRSDALRPSGWTSADAAGLPILPGLLRQDEVAAGFVGHAIRMTVQTTDKSFIWPARHEAGSVNDPDYPPMGARFRLKASVDISRFSRDTQVVLTAMKHYGLIVADNGSNWFFQGAAQPGWDNTMLDELKSIPVSDFEAVDTSSLMINPNSGAARQ